MDYSALRRKLPEATYRLQFNAGFTFKDAAAIVDYQHDLGITHCYASPYLTARVGSQHGYDIVDHRALNPEIGSQEDYDRWVASLHARGMGQILDIVPNHMGIACNDNVWWNDVLENGPASPYATYFDIAWEDSPRSELYQKVLIPVLGDPYGKVLEAQQLKLEYVCGAFSISYFSRRFPVAPRSYAMILGYDIENLEKLLGPEHPELLEYKSILTAIAHLPLQHETAPEKIEERQREKEVIKRRLTKLCEESKEVRESIEKTVEVFNGKAGDRHSFDLLDRLLDDQGYRLSYWRVAADEINYRRFFDINDLAALSMEKIEVFTATHDLVLRLAGDDKIDGFRIDHPDGLYDPKQYLRRLQKHYLLACAKKVFISDPEYQELDWKTVEAELLERLETSIPPELEPFYVVVEKILGATEELQPTWVTHGTSGYEFLCMVNGLFVDSSSEEMFTSIYEHWTGDDTSFAEIVYEKKSLILRDAMSSELHMLARQLDKLAQKNRWSRDFTQNGLRSALAEVIACFPVYRSYIADEEIAESDRKTVETAVRRAIKRNPTTSKSLFRFIRDMLLLRYPDPGSEEDRAEQRRFAGKFQQVTSPVMAKGVEDTAFYVFNRLVSLNEVGGDPSRFGNSPGAVHHFNQNRQVRWPHALSPLSTHDTKRSEDVRARLNVLSEVPAEWQQCLERWNRMNERFRTIVDDAPVPDLNEEYLLYQTMLGIWPLEAVNGEIPRELVDRIHDYMMKALHEAKVNTSWINPNEAYDEAIGKFIHSILDESDNPAFLKDLRGYARRISHFGMLNSLAQTLLKITLPGVPDTYQGTELWDFSLVDPDNRRQVDYECRRKLLDQLKTRIAQAGTDRRALTRDLLDSWVDGRIKLYLTWQALLCRAANSGLFTSGDYIPLIASGRMQDHVFAFMRQNADTRAVVVVPRLMTRLVDGPAGLPLGPTAWMDTRVQLPDAGAGGPSLTLPARHGDWRNLFTGATLKATVQDGEPGFALSELLLDFPVALLVWQVEAASKGINDA
jgi:(1->4)-alpha-D-glucan 1-alpha-D-glucosylmutase